MDLITQGQKGVETIPLDSAPSSEGTVVAPSWVRNPQDPADEHDWVNWFLPGTEFRGKVWNYGMRRWEMDPNPAYEIYTRRSEPDV